MLLADVVRFQYITIVLWAKVTIQSDGVFTLNEIYH